VLAFHHCDKIAEKVNFKGGKNYFGSRFWRFQSTGAWPYHFGLVGEKVWERERESGEREGWGKGPNMPFKVMSPVT
jgi:hypothetical protein